jgi:hypothetical protein
MFNRYLAWLGPLACRAVVYRMATARRVFRPRSPLVQVSMAFLCFIAGSFGSFAPPSYPLTSHLSLVTPLLAPIPHQTPVSRETSPKAGIAVAKGSERA